MAISAVENDLVTVGSEGVGVGSASGCQVGNVAVTGFLNFGPIAANRALASAFRFDEGATAGLNAANSSMSSAANVVTNSGGVAITSGPQRPSLCSGAE